MSENSHGRGSSSSGLMRGAAKTHQAITDVLDTTKAFVAIGKTLGFYASYPFVLTHWKLGARIVRPFPILITMVPLLVIGHNAKYISLFLLGLLVPVLAGVQFICSRIRIYRKTHGHSYDIGDSLLLVFTLGRFPCTINCVIEPTLIAAFGFFTDFPPVFYIAAATLALTRWALYRQSWNTLMDQLDQAYDGEALSDRIAAAQHRGVDVPPAIARDVAPVISGNVGQVAGIPLAALNR